MNRKKVTLLNNKGQKLVGYLYKGDSKTLLIVCHGMQNFNDLPEATDYFEAYRKTGCSVFSFDFSGFGESEGMDKLSIKQKVDDIGSIVHHFKKNYTDFILYGVSLGAPIASIASIKYNEVSGLIVINGAYNYWQLRSKKLIAWILLYLLFHKTQREEDTYVKTYLLPESISVPTLVVYGAKDEIVNPVQSMQFYNQLRSQKELLVIPEGDHALRGNFDSYLQKIYLWLEVHKK